jgi:hypothetical protein
MAVPQGTSRNIFVNDVKYVRLSAKIEAGDNVGVVKLRKDRGLAYIEL